MKMEGPAWDNFMHGVQASIRELRDSTVRQYGIDPIERLMADPAMTQDDRRLLARARATIRLELAHADAKEMDWAYTLAQIEASER